MLFSKKNILGIIVSLTIYMPTAFAKNGMYVGVECGYAKQSTITDPSTLHATTEARFPSAVRAQIGYNHDLYPFFGFGMEIARAYLAKVDYFFYNGSATYQAATTEFLTSAQLHFKKLDYFLKLGVVRDTITVRFYRLDDVVRVNRPEIAIGTALNINTHVASTLAYYHIFGAGYNHFEVTPFDIKNGTMNVVVVGLRYTF